MTRADFKVGEVALHPGERAADNGSASAHPGSIDGDAAAAFRSAGARLSDMLERFSRNAEVSRYSNLDTLARELRDSSSPEEAMPFENYLDYLEAHILPYAVNVSSPRCLGHMAGGVPRFASLLAQFVTALNQNLVKSEASQAFTLIERQTIGMMHSLIFGYPSSFYDQHIQTNDSALGIMTSGSTIANITGLWIARNRAFGPAADSVGASMEGLDAPLAHHSGRRAVIVGSTLMHYSFDKAANLLGLRVCKVPADAAGRIELDLLRESVDRCLQAGERVISIVGVAGTTDCGSIDSINEMADVAAEAGSHFHIDAAWGAPLMFSRRYRLALAGIERADSVAVDGHKQMMLPLGTSMLLLRDPTSANAIKQKARYMLQEHSSDLGRYSLEGSRPNTALYLHAALHVIGREGYESIIDENMRKTAWMCDEIRRRPEFELVVPSQTNIVLYRYVPEYYRHRRGGGGLSESDNARISAFNERLQQAQFRAGRSYVSRTLMDNTEHYRDVPIIVLRAVLGNPNTTDRDIAFLLDDQTEIAAGLDNTMDDRPERPPPLDQGEQA